MGWFQKFREWSAKLLEWYEHATSILELFGLGWRDIRDAATLTAVIAPMIRLQDLPIQYLGVSLLVMFAASLGIIYFGIGLWKKLKGVDGSSLRLTAWRTFRRFVNVALTVGLALSWYNAGKQHQPIAPSSSSAPVAAAPPQPPRRLPASYTQNEKKDLRNALRELSKILNTDGTDLANKANATMAAWATIIDYAKPLATQELQNNLAGTANAAIKLRSDLEDMNGPLKEYWTYHDEILAIINFSDKPNSRPEPVSAILGPAEGLSRVAAVLGDVAKYNDAGLLRAVATMDVNAPRPFETARENFTDWLKQADVAISKFRASL
jgi:hypothetical protein